MSLSYHMYNKTLSSFNRPLRIVILVLGCLSAGGCGLIGSFYGIFIDPLIPRPKVAAEHDMSDKTVLIWVDDVFLDQPSHLLRRELTKQLAAQLLDHQAVAKVIDYNRITTFRSLHPHFADMTIQQFGQGLDAQEVLYLLIDKMQLQHQAGKGFYRPSLSGCGKVIDVATGKRLWPADQSRRPFFVTGPLEQGQGQAFEDHLVKQLSGQLVEIITPSFYRHRQARPSGDKI